MQSALRISSIIHLALCFGLALGLGVFYLLGSRQPIQADPGAEAPADPQVFLIAAFAMAAMGAVGSFVLPGVLLANMKNSSKAEPDSSYTPLDEARLHVLSRQYQTAKIVQWAVTEGPGFFCAAVYFITGQMPLLFGGAALLLLLVYHRPSREDFLARMGLNSQQVP